jgi:hypothetical protein
MYGVEIGEMITLDLGEFQGNDLGRGVAYVNYEIKSTSNDSLKDNFNVVGFYKNEKVSLEIDLRTLDPIMVNSSVSGELSVENQARKGIQYDVNFQLLCSNLDFCPRKEERVDVAAEE